MSGSPAVTTKSGSSAAIAATGSRAVVLRQLRRGWEVADLSRSPGMFEPLPLAPDLPAAETGEALAAALGERGLTGRPVLIAVASETCSTAALDVAEPSRLTRAALIYELEDRLLDAAEELAVDFYLRPEGALGIGVRLADLQPTIAALETHGCPVRSVLPWTCLTAEAVRSRCEEVDVVLFLHDERCELFVYDGQTPTAWSTLSDNPDAVAIALKGLVLDGGRRLTATCLAAGELQARLSLQLPDIRFVEANWPSSPETLALEQAARFLLRPLTPHLELLRDGLSPRASWSELQRPLAYLATGLAATALILFGSFLHAAWTYDAAAARFSEQQAAVYRALHPGRPVPPGVRSRLESELRQLQGAGGAAGADIPQESAFVAVHEVLAALPATVRFRLLDLKAEGHRVEFAGEARSHREAEALSSALAAAGRFEVEPVATVSLGDRGVRFTLSARLALPQGTEAKP